MKEGTVKIPLKEYESLKHNEQEKKRIQEENQRLSTCIEEKHDTVMTLFRGHFGYTAVASTNDKATKELFKMLEEEKERHKTLRDNTFVQFDSLEDSKRCIKNLETTFGYVKLNDVLDLL